MLDFYTDNVDASYKMGLLTIKTSPALTTLYLSGFQFEMFNTNIEIDFLKGDNYSEKERKYLLYLFSRSISFSKKEKKDLLFFTLPKLSINKINRFVGILEEEITGFNMMYSKYNNLIDEIAKKRFKTMKEWLEIEIEYSEAKQEYMNYISKKYKSRKDFFNSFDHFRIKITTFL